MKKQLYFILIPTHFNNALEVAEKFKSVEFDNLNCVPETITSELTQDNDAEEEEEVLVMSLSAFTDFYNESESATGYFIAPVFIN